MCTRKIFNFLVMWIEIDVFIRMFIKRIEISVNIWNFTKWIQIGVNTRNFTKWIEISLIIPIVRIIPFEIPFKLFAKFSAMWKLAPTVF